MLPEVLAQGIERLTRLVSFSQLEKSAHELSSAYRKQSEGLSPSKSYMVTYEQKIAYLALRMPATFAAILECLKHIQTPIKTLLDVGSGPATAFWAAWSSFPGLQRALLLEKDAELIKIGQELVKPLSFPAVYRQQELSTFVPESHFDLAIAAYVLSELSLWEPLVERLYQSATQFLIVEPGTPYGYRTILKAREFLIQKGAFILAPCTHEAKCPLANSSDWCHFAARLPRTKMQRLVKGAKLGYEDEKYSYLLVSKTPSLKRPESRVIKTPEKHSGHVRLTLCNINGLETKIISRKNKEIYREARKLDWGDSFSR